MIAAILRILIFALIVWFIRRVLLSFTGRGQANAGKRKPPEPEKSGLMVKDAQCGMYLDARLAIRLEQSEKTLYFCSEDCKVKYLTAHSPLP